ncbi:MAG: hypothetical protein ACLS7Z_06585 [Christensenellales bacterium]
MKKSILVRPSAYFKRLLWVKGDEALDAKQILSANVPAHSKARRRCFG